MIRILFYLPVFVWLLPSLQGAAQTVQFQQLNMENGLSQNHITSFLKDSRGFLWIGTSAGLNRYDGHDIKIFRHVPGQATSLVDNDIVSLFSGPNGKLWVKTKLGTNIYDDRRERFIRNTDSVLSALGLPVTEVLDIRRDAEGRCWFLQTGGLLSMYDERKAATQRIPLTEPGPPVTGIALDREGSLWTVNAHGTVKKPLAGDMVKYHLQNSIVESGQKEENFSLFVDSQMRPWVYVPTKHGGLYWWPRAPDRPVHISNVSEGMQLNNPIVFDVSEALDGQIWIATDHGGVNVLDPVKRRVSYLVNDEFDDRTIAQNSVTTLYRDTDGIMWAGTFKRGVSFYHPQQIRFALYQRQRGSREVALPFDDINRFAETPDGNVWIGTNGGGLIYFDRKNNRFKQYRHNPYDSYSLGSDVIVSLHLDREGILWIGTYHGGLNRFDGKRFTRYMHSPSNPETIADNSVWEIYEDSRGRCWIGTLNAGLNLLDKRTGKFTRLGFGEGGFTMSAYISSIAEDHQGGMWFGTASGIELLTPADTFKRFRYSLNDPNGISNDYVNDILEDRQHRIWIATRDGLNLYNAEKGTFSVFRTEDGLPDNTVLTLLEDRNGTIWVSTVRGISAIKADADNPGRWRFWNYGRRDGLQANAFNENAAGRMASGELFFGGPSGFNIIDPAHVLPVPKLGKPVLTDFQLFNRSVDPSEWLDRKEIKLAHDQNFLSLVVASLYFLNKDRAYFRYKLAGVDQEWQPLDHHTRKATFTNLDPGSYRFQVMVSGDGETWSGPHNLTTIVIRPPVWKTGWAYFLYALTGIGSILLIRHVERTREKTRFALQRERQEARSKLESVLKQQASLEQAYKKKLDVFPSEKPVMTADESFLRKALETVEQHLGDGGFSVESFADAMNVSRVSLYKRILTLTGYTPSEFIRNIRLRRGAQLLEHSGLTVAEIAYQVGFSNPKQFSKYFKQLYGVAPSAYRK